jgi:hypothetical protein
MIEMSMVSRRNSNQSALQINQPSYGANTQLSMLFTKFYMKEKMLNHLGKTYR